MNRLFIAIVVVLSAVQTALGGPIGDSARSVGLTPEALTASGLSATEVDEVLTRVSEAEVLREQITTAKAARDAAASAVVTCRTNIQENSPTEQLYLLLQQAVEHLQTCQEAVVAAEKALRDHGVGAVSTDARLRFQTYHEARAYDVPDEFKVVVRSDDAWRQLEAAVLAERVAVAEQLPTPQQHAASLVSVRSEQAVVIAQTALANNLAASSALFQNR